MENFSQRTHADPVPPLTETAAIENELRQVVDALPGFVWTARPNGEVDFLNQRWCDYTGLSVEESYGQGWQRAVHPEDLPHILRQRESALSSGEPREAEGRIRRHDGTYRWFLFRTSPITDASGAVVKWCGMNSDIERRKRGEKLLSESEQRFKTIFDEAGTGIALVDLFVGEPVGNNRALQSMLGCSEEELSHHATFNELTYEPNRQRDAELFNELCVGRLDNLRMEKHFVLKDGRSVWSNAIFTLLRDCERRPRYIIVIHEDITERKRALEKLQAQEQELRRSAAFLAQAQHLSSTGSFAWHLSTTNQITWSEELYRIFELDRAAPITTELIRMRVHPEDVAQFDKTVLRARTMGEDFECQYRLLLPDDSIKYLRVVAKATRDQAGQLEYIAAVQDVTERHLSEQAIDKARSELAHVARVMSLGALTASIAHEVNQPLSGIVTNASTCLRMLDAEPPNVDGARETARRTIRDARRASDVIVHLRALFGRKDMVAEPVDLNETTKEVIGLLRNELQRNQVALQAELANDLPRVAADRIQLQQVIFNLIRNAADAMNDIHDRPRQLVIKTENGGDSVCLQVQDTGIGVDPQVVDQLFQPFYTTKNDGMGIGLSVSRSIIDSHNGRLWATRNDGPGTTFSFCIPRHE